MDDSKITDGRLLAYLDDRTDAQVEQALRTSPELCARLDALRQEQEHFRRFLRQSYFSSTTSWIEPQALVNVVTGQADTVQRLRVLAYVRRFPQAQQMLDKLQKEWRAMLAVDSRRSPIFLMQPVLAAGLRGIQHAQAFKAVEMHAQVLVEIQPPVGERWQMHGQVMVADQPAAGARVHLRSAQAHPRPRLTDDSGFFAFHRLRDGEYRLRIVLEDGVLVIPQLTLEDD